MSINIVQSRPFSDQKPGTSGLRKKVPVFKQVHYLENFIQAIINACPGLKNQTLVLGGDGRYYNEHAIQTIIQMAAANDIRRLIIGQHGWLSTPAASCLIRKYHAAGGIILSASHNPAGEDGDFGVKFNTSNGGPAPETITNDIYQASKNVHEYRIYESNVIDISKLGHHKLGKMQIEIIDPVDDYEQLMEKLFDFDIIQKALDDGLSICFDAMHAITGPYAKRILGERFGIAEKYLLNTTPLVDFGGGHPDPNLTHAGELLAIMNGTDAVDLGAASDGDGDRNMIVGNNCFVSPSDSLAILTANAHLIPAFSSGIAGVARSMPTSGAVDKVAEQLNIDCYETPTGWKFFGNLLDNGNISICGEESFGTGSNHIREKDGLWAVLFWLNLLAVKQQSVQNILIDHWQRFGRHYYGRHDYENIPVARANQLMEKLTDKLAKLTGQQFSGLTVTAADEFSYCDPVDQSLSTHQGVRIQFSDGSRLVYRLSGTGTEGATLRVYLEKYETDTAKLNLNSTEVLEPIAYLSDFIAHIQTITGKTKPDVIT